MRSDASTKEILNGATNFGGKEEQWADFEFQFLNVVRSKQPTVAKVIEWVGKQKEFDTDDVQLEFNFDDPEELNSVGIELYEILALLVQGDALTLLRNDAERNGLKSWHKLTKKYNPRNPGRGLIALIQVVTPGRAKNYNELPNMIEKWEGLVTQMERDYNETMSDKMRAAILTGMCPHDLQEMVFQQMGETTEYKGVKERITSIIANRQATQQPKPMVIGELDDSYWKQGYWCQEQEGKTEEEAGEEREGEESLNYYGKGKGGYEKGKGKGKSGDKGKGKGKQCYNCGQEGHFARDGKCGLANKGKGNNKGWNSGWGQKGGGYEAGKGWNNSYGKGVGKSWGTGNQYHHSNSHYQNNLANSGALNLCSIDEEPERWTTVTRRRWGATKHEFRKPVFYDSEPRHQGNGDHQHNGVLQHCGEHQHNGEHQCRGEHQHNGEPHHKIERRHYNMLRDNRFRELLERENDNYDDLEEANEENGEEQIDTPFRGTRPSEGHAPINVLYEEEEVNELNQGALEWTRFEVVMDSGAAAPVAPKTMASWIPIVPSEGSKRGQHYIAANGERIPNLGERTLDLVTDEGSAAVAKFNVAEVNRPLCSITAVCDKGNEVVFRRDGGTIYNETTGQTTNFSRSGNVYTMGMWMLKPGFQGQSD